MHVIIILRYTHTLFVARKIYDSFFFLVYFRDFIYLLLMPRCIFGYHLNQINIFEADNSVHIYDSIRFIIALTPSSIRIISVILFHFLITCYSRMAQPVKRNMCNILSNKTQITHIEFPVVRMNPVTQNTNTETHIINTYLNLHIHSPAWIFSIT